MQRTKTEYRLNETTVHPLAASEIDVGAVIMIEGYPCKLTDVRRDEYAANGNATDMKIKVCGKDIFDGRTHSQLLRLHDEVEAVSVIFEECRVVRIKDDLIEMVDEFEDPRAAVVMPEDPNLAEELRAQFLAGFDSQITVMLALGHELIVDVALPPADKIREIFDALDTNNSGDLEKDELWLVLEKTGHEFAEQMIDMVDKDGDGVVNFAEFRELFTSNSKFRQLMMAKAPRRADS